MGEFRLVEHTADISVEVNAHTLQDLFITSAEAYYNVVGTFNDDLHLHEELEVNLTSTNIEYLLIEFLGEINYQLNVKHNFCGKIFSLNLGKNNNGVFLDCRLGSRKIDAESDILKEEIKAVTYHNINIRKTDNGLKVTIVFDI